MPLHGILVLYILYKNWSKKRKKGKDYGGLDGGIADRDPPHLPPGMWCAFHDRGVETGIRKPERGGETADPRSNHDDALVRHARAPRFAATERIDLAAPKCQ